MRFELDTHSMGKNSAMSTDKAFSLAAYSILSHSSCLEAALGAPLSILRRSKRRAPASLPYLAKHLGSSQLAKD